MLLCKSARSAKTTSKKSLDSLKTEIYFLSVLEVESSRSGQQQLLSDEVSLSGLPMAPFITKSSHGLLSAYAWEDSSLACLLLLIGHQCYLIRSVPYDII